MSPELYAEVLHAAKRAVDENVRHSHESLFERLCDLYPERQFPELTQEDIEAICEEAL